MAASVAQHHAGPQLLLRRPSSCSVTETLQTPQPTATATMAGESPLIRSQPSQVRLEQQAATPLTPGPGAGSTEPAADTPTPCPHYTDLSVDHRARLASTPSWLPLLGLALGTCAAGSDAAPMFQAPDRLMEGDISGSSGMYGAHLLQLLTEHLRTLFQRFADRQLTRDGWRAPQKEEEKEKKEKKNEGEEERGRKNNNNEKEEGRKKENANAILNQPLSSSSSPFSSILPFFFFFHSLFFFLLLLAFFLI